MLALLPDKDIVLTVLFVIVQRTSNGNNRIIAYSMSQSSLFDDAQFEHMIQGMGEDVAMIDEILGRAQVDRSSAVQRQKQAIANYDKEMQEIEEIEFYGLKRWESMMMQDPT
jgi:hypothetical protein